MDIEQASIFTAFLLTQEGRLDETTFAGVYGLFVLLTLILLLNRLKLGDWRPLTVWGQRYIESCLKRLGGKVAMTPMIVMPLTWYNAIKGITFKFICNI